MCLILCFKQHILKCDIIMCLACVFFFLSGDFLISTIILLIFVRGVHVREREGRKGERINKEKDEVCMWERERESCSFVKSYQVDPTLF